MGVYAAFSAQLLHSQEESSHHVLLENSTKSRHPTPPVLEKPKSEYTPVATIILYYNVIWISNNEVTSYLAPSSTAAAPLCFLLALEVKIGPFIGRLLFFWLLNH